MKNLFKLICISLVFYSVKTNAQTITAIQQQNARATGYAIVAARNPGKSFSVFLVKWDGIHDLEYNANNQINRSWHPQAVIKGNYFNQEFDNSDFTTYSSVLVSQAEFDTYKSTGTDWWIVCSTLPSFSNYSLSVSDNGNIGIGTAAPDEKLTVKGKIHAEEVKIDLSIPAPDYVFASDYKLKTLEEVETFIKINRHLPEIPSAKEIEKNGLMLAEMNMSLLKKVEELTLYMIEQSKEIETLKKENDTFKNLPERFSKIESQLKKTK
jgi:hypothetical protein